MSDGETLNPDTDAEKGPEPDAVPPQDDSSGGDKLS